MSIADRRPRMVLASCFFAGGIGIGTWGANLPALGRRTGMDEGQIGLVLLCFAAGAIPAMVRAPRLIARLGAERVAIAAAVLFGLGLASVGLASRMLVAALAATLCGVTFGTLDVAMNSRAAVLEAKATKPLMSSFHAMFSGGTLAAAASYAWLAHLGIDMPISLACAGAVIASLALAAVAWSDGPQPDVPAAAPKPARSSGNAATDRGHVLALGAVAFVIFFAEGAIMDWAAIYLVRVMGAAESTGALGYAIFAGMMLLGRLVGGRAIRSFGPVALFRAGTLTVAVSLGALLMSPSVLPGLLALGLCGLGMANVIPVLFSAAGQLGLRDGGRSMSKVLTLGYAGILVGPAFIGFLAEAASLTASLGFVALASAVTFLCGRMVFR